MVYCFAFGCNHQSLREHCKFFRFPLKDAELLGQWKVACRRADRDPNQYDRLCSCHFKDNKKENGPTLFSGEEVEKSNVKREDASPWSVSSSTNANATGGVANSVSGRRKRLRIEFVSFGLQNGKLKRVSSAMSASAVKEEPSASMKSKLPTRTDRADTDRPSGPMTKEQLKWLRTIDRIRCLAFREARDAGASFISVRWVADSLNRSPAFVKKHWRGRYQDCLPPSLFPDIHDGCNGDGGSEEGSRSPSPPPPSLLAGGGGKAVGRHGRSKPITHSHHHQQQAQRHNSDDEAEGLHDDWDPIMEERNVIEGLLLSGSADEEMDANDITDGDGVSLCSLAPASDSTPTVDIMGRQLMQSINLSPTESLLSSTVSLPTRRRPQQRGKTTPKMRSDSALAEKNDLCDIGADADEEEEEEEEEEAENTPLKCTQCGRKFSTTANLERHIRLHGISVGPFVCPQCGSVFAKRRGLVRHLRVHGGEPRYACETCGKGFAQRTNLEKHRRLHTGERAYACRLCDRKFMEQEHLTSHMLQHSGERPYSCDFCDKRFKMQCHLVSHLRSHVPPLLAAQNASV